MAYMEGTQGSREGGCKGSHQNMVLGSLAWMPCTEQGFETVKVLDIVLSTRSAQVEVHPEGVASVAAAHAAAELVCKASAGFSTGQSPTATVIPTTKRHQQEFQNKACAVRPPVDRTRKVYKKLQSRGWLLHVPSAATEAFADPLSPSSAHKLLQSSATLETGEEEDSDDLLNGTEAPQSDSQTLPSAAQLSFSDRKAGSSTSLSQIEAAAAAAARDAAAAAIAAFVPRPPLTVPLAHLWPYTPPPMPPHQVPDDSASYGTLSAAALLQQLQHRYLRNDIYTYAAHVLLAVNPYKPLPHFYSAQQILLYRHWREVARAYRGRLHAESGETTRKRDPQYSNTTSSGAIRSILNNLSGVLPLKGLPGDSCLTSSSCAAALDGDELSFNPWTRNNSGNLGESVWTAEGAAAAAAAEQSFTESTARQNRPPPHPFAVAEEALRRLVGTQTNQTIVVSGQSGAGKTETSKQLMLFLTHVSTFPDSRQDISGYGVHQVPSTPLNVSEQRRRVSAITGGVQTLCEAAELRKRIVSCNAIFESFGNAATRRNHNSSRVGRLTSLHFDSGGLLRGGSLRTYLLEAARLTAHKMGDRNFHVFYQLIRGASHEERASLGLAGEAAAYRMLQPQESRKLLQKVILKGQQEEESESPRESKTQEGKQVPERVDQENFKAMVEALKRAEFSSEEVKELLQLLAGLLHLSNISFIEGDGDLLELRDKAAEEAVSRAVSLLGLEGQELKELLRCRRIRLKGDTVVTRRNQQQSVSACFSLIKFIYCRIFDHIVHRLNKSAGRQMERQKQHATLLMPVEEGKNSDRSIGILDIYGFESFGLENGLEQLCINYANEKQQELFVQRVIQEEVALYIREGIANPAVTIQKNCLLQQEHERQEAVQSKELGDSFKDSLKQSLFSSLPDSSTLLRDLQEGVFRRLDDSCRLLAQGQQRDDLHFWKDLFAYCVSSKQQQQQKGQKQLLQQSHQLSVPNQCLLFCLKGIHGVYAAEAAANGQLLQQLQHADLTSIGLVAADQLASRGTRNAAGGTPTGTAVAGKVQEKVFAVKHFAGTVLYGTDGWLNLNNDRIEYELERLVAKSERSLLQQAMEQHEARHQQDGGSTVAAGGGQFSSITKRFVKSVKDLNQDLQGPQMQLHFIRCFIPNNSMRPDNFERRTVLQQLQHSGTLALVDILHSGFPHRLPLSRVAARLRTSLGPLVQQRLQDQEHNVKQLLAQKEQMQHTAADSAVLDKELRQQRRMLETLRHCNPATARDRTLVSAALGLLPQCRPGTFICGVSLICLKEPAYREAAELMEDPSHFFKTPADLCRLIVAIQRLRWRVAARIVLHVHPTLLWLQRRAFLMRRIKEETVTVAVRILLLQKHILMPLRERIQRRLAVRRGTHKLEQMLLRRGLLAWQQYRAAVAAAEFASVAAEAPPAAKRKEASSSKTIPPPLDLSSMRADAAGTYSEDDQSHHGIQLWNSCLFPPSGHGGTDAGPCDYVAIHPGKGLYSINFEHLSSTKGDPLVSEPSTEQPLLEPQSLYVASFVEQQHKHFDPSALQAVSAGESTATTPHNRNTTKGPPLVTIAKHPSYTNLFLACNSAAQLLVFAAPENTSARVQGKQETEGHIEGSMKGPLTPFGEPSTCLPRLCSPAGYPTDELLLRNANCNGVITPKRANIHPSTFIRVKTLPPLPEWLRHCDLKDGSYPANFLPKAPISPSKWLPRDLLQQVSKSSQKHSGAPPPRPPTVRPLRVSFADPLTADYALVVCLVQGNNSNSNNGCSVEKLAVVLVDIVGKASRGWLQLSFAANDLSGCARCHSAYLQQLFAASPTGPSSSSGKNCNTAEFPITGRQRSASRNRSNMLSTVRLQPLWGNMWVVVGPSLLALFSVNLRFLQHPHIEFKPDEYEPPLHLLWNLGSIPLVNGMSFRMADAWFTGCTYTRLAPPGLESVSGTDPVVQFLQLMPYGPVARSLEARMQRLLLLSTADNALLLMQYSQRRTAVTTCSGNLVILDKVQLPSPILQFFRQEPERDIISFPSAASSHERAFRLLRTFPWEGGVLVQQEVAGQKRQSHRTRCGLFQGSGRTTASGSGTNLCNSAGERQEPQSPAVSNTRDSQTWPLIRNFSSYGLAVMLRNSGRVLRSLDPQSLREYQDSKETLQGQLLAVTPLPPFCNMLASVRMLLDGTLSMCLSNDEGNWMTVGNMDLHD